MIFSKALECRTDRFGQKSIWRQVDQDRDLPAGRRAPVFWGLIGQLRDMDRTPDRRCDARHTDVGAPRLAWPDSPELSGYGAIRPCRSARAGIQLTQTHGAERRICCHVTQSDARLWSAGRLDLLAGVAIATGAYRWRGPGSSRASSLVGSSSDFWSCLRYRRLLTAQLLPR